MQSVNWKKGARVVLRVAVQMRTPRAWSLYWIGCLLNALGAHIEDFGEGLSKSGVRLRDFATDLLTKHALRRLEKRAKRKGGE